MKTFINFLMGLVTVVTLLVVCFTFVAGLVFGCYKLNDGEKTFTEYLYYELYLGEIQRNRNASIIITNDSTMMDDVNIDNMNITQDVLYNSTSTLGGADGTMSIGF